MTALSFKMISLSQCKNDEYALHCVQAEAEETEDSVTDRPGSSEYTRQNRRLLIYFIGRSQTRSIDQSNNHNHNRSIRSENKIKHAFALNVLNNIKGRMTW